MGERIFAENEDTHTEVQSADEELTAAEPDNSELELKNLDSRPASSSENRSDSGVLHHDEVVLTPGEDNPKKSTTMPGQPLNTPEPKQSSPHQSTPQTSEVANHSSLTRDVAADVMAKNENFRYSDDSAKQSNRDISKMDQGNLQKSVKSKTITSPKIKPELDRAAPEIMAILKRGILRVGMCTIDQPPFHVMGRNGEFVGFDIDLSRDIGEALGVQVQFVKAPDWASTVNLLLDEKIDLILSNLTLLPERTAKIYCSQPYAKIRQCVLLNRVLLTRAASKGLLTLRDVFTNGVNRNLIIQEGTAYETSAPSMFPKANISITSSWDEIMNKIRNRECLGTISDEIEIKKQMRSVQTMELLYVALKGMYDRMVIGVSHNAPHLLHYINNYLICNNVECNLEEF